MRAIVLGGALVGVVGAAAVAALLHFYGGGTDRDRAGLDVVRTAGALVAGTGGAIALLLAARRQRSTELTLEHQWLTLEHQREVAATVAQDAVEQRITEIYTRAVDQIGNDQALVRLGGLHALERLAQQNSAQRQTIVDVICAYLRMPYALPDDEPLGEDASAKTHLRYERQRQELQVRLTAQRILAAHLRTDAVHTFWPDIDLDLTKAQLHQFDLTHCHIRKAQFSGAQFTEYAGFAQARFAVNAAFEGARFTGYAAFEGARFTGNAGFAEAQFTGYADFKGARFAGKAEFSGARLAGGGAGFSGARFAREAEFSTARFAVHTDFEGARFTGDAEFSGAHFSGYAEFSRAQFSGDTIFARYEVSGGEAVFDMDVGFDGARARPMVEGRVHVWPATWSTREAREGEEDGWVYLVRVEK